MWFVVAALVAAVVTVALMVAALWCLHRPAPRYKRGRS